MVLQILSGVIPEYLNLGVALMLLGVDPKQKQNKQKNPGVTPEHICV